MEVAIRTLNAKTEYWRVKAREVRVGDVVCFDQPRHDVRIDDVSHSQTDSSIGLHGNGGTWSTFYKPDDIVRVR